MTLTRASHIAPTASNRQGLLASSHYQELPLGPLNPSRVDALWRFESPVPCRQRVLPDGRMDLVAHALRGADGELKSVWLAIAGPFEVWSEVPVRAGMLSLGARFQLGWGGVCLGLAPAALRNQVQVGAPVANLLGPLAPRLLNARTPAALQQALSAAVQVLSERAEPSPVHGRALHAIAQLQPAPFHAAPVDLPPWGASPNPSGRSSPLADASSASPRALRRDVQQAVGLSLRTLAGVLRFQRAVALLNARAASSLADLADHAGYADQAHMTREFRRFGGFTPALPPLVPLLGGVQAAWPKASRPQPEAWPHSTASTQVPCHAHPSAFCDP